MKAAELKLECLKVAAGFLSDEAKPDEVVKVAAFFYMFASGEINVQATPQSTPGKKAEGEESNTGGVS